MTSSAMVVYTVQQSQVVFLMRKISRQMDVLIMQMAQKRTIWLAQLSMLMVACCSSDRYHTWRPLPWCTAAMLSAESTTVSAVAKTMV